ncbi:MAG TPA: hypothetical protein VGN32_20000 [Ktedonobacterales bacterium]|nr:hypothetical protein [Ktedonobacterales bacterium]
MSEYQRYEFMTRDRPLTREQLAAVNALSSHIDASSTHALIEYHWGDFKHDPIKVLREFFDGFLYWANWGAPRLALRFPHGILPGDLIEGYDLDDDVAFKQYSDYDILDIHFGELEGPDEWTEYDLGSLIGIREELMQGDRRALYIVWLAEQEALGSYDEEEEYEISVPAVPPGLSTLTAAEQALAELLQVPEELLVAAARHSAKAAEATGKGTADDDLAAWVKLLPTEVRDAYLLRLARNEPGLSHLLARELRALGQGTSDAMTAPAGKRVTYATLRAEASAIAERLEREKREQQRQDHLRHLREVYEERDSYWRQIEQATERTTGARYEEAVRVLVELREAAVHFNDSAAFEERFRAWVGPLLRRPALVKRLSDHGFSIPEL